MSAPHGAFVLATPDPPRLADAYARLLGWVAVLRDPVRERPGLSFQLEPDHVAPVWPPPPDGHPFCLFLEGS